MSQASFPLLIARGKGAWRLGGQPLHDGLGRGSLQHTQGKRGIQQMRSQSPPPCTVSPRHGAAAQPRCWLALWVTPKTTVESVSGWASAECACSFEAAKHRTGRAFDLSSCIFFPRREGRGLWQLPAVASWASASAASKAVSAGSRSATARPPIHRREKRDLFIVTGVKRTGTGAGRYGCGGRGIHHTVSTHTSSLMHAPPPHPQGGSVDLHSRHGKIEIRERLREEKRTTAPATRSTCILRAFGVAGPLLCVCVSTLQMPEIVNRGQRKGRAEKGRGAVPFR